MVSQAPEISFEGRAREPHPEDVLAELKGVLFGEVSIEDAFCLSILIC
jgi:hypothetical protein